MNSTTAIKRVEHIDILRGISIILMIMGHIDFGPFFDKYIHAFHMPIWFFVSGYLWNTKDMSYFKFFCKIAKSLLIPYFVYGLIQYPIWIALVWDRSSSILEPLKNLFWCNTELVMPIAGAIWFLTCLFFAENIFYFVIRIKSSILSSCIVFVLSILGCFFTTIFPFRLPWAIDTSFVAVGIMWIGFVFKKIEQRGIMQKMSELSWFKTVILFVIHVLLVFANGSVNMRIGSYSNVLLFWVNCVISILCYWNICKHLNKLKTLIIVRASVSYLCRVGKDSIVYLCLNQMVILVLKIIIDNVLQINSNWLIRGIVMLVVSMLILYVLDKLIMNTALRITLGKGRIHVSGDCINR